MEFLVKDMLNDFVSVARYNNMKDKQSALNELERAMDKGLLLPPASRYHLEHLTQQEEN